MRIPILVAALALQARGQPPLTPISRQVIHRLPVTIEGVILTPQILTCI
jgi:hypothetical protein